VSAHNDSRRCLSLHWLVSSRVNASEMDNLAGRVTESTANFGHLQKSEQSGNSIAKWNRLKFG